MRISEQQEETLALAWHRKTMDKETTRTTCEMEGINFDNVEKRYKELSGKGIKRWHKYLLKHKVTGREFEAYFTATLFFDANYNSYEPEEVEVLEDLGQPYLDEQRDVGELVFV